MGHANLVRCGVASETHVCVVYPTFTFHVCRIGRSSMSGECFMSDQRWRSCCTLSDGNHNKNAGALLEEDIYTSYKVYSYNISYIYQVWHSYILYIKYIYYIYYIYMSPNILSVNIMIIWVLLWMTKLYLHLRAYWYTLLVVAVGCVGDGVVLEQYEKREKLISTMLTYCSFDGCCEHTLYQAGVLLRPKESLPHSRAGQRRGALQVLGRRRALLVRTCTSKLSVSISILNNNCT